MTIDELITNLTAQASEAEAKKNELEKQFADTKLNPYGVTTIDFADRQELYELILKLQGGVEALQLAKSECELS